MIFFWSLIAFFLTGLIIWLIFFADDDAVLRLMRIPTDEEQKSNGTDGDAAPALDATEGDRLSAPVSLAQPTDDAPAGETAAAAVATTVAADAGADEPAAADDATNGATVAEPMAESTAEPADEQLDTAAATRSAPAVALDSGLTRTDNYPDNLTKIPGIGEVYQRRFYENGVYTYAQIAALDQATLERMTDAIDAANAQDWAAEARRLAQAAGRENARYEGPAPDRFTFLPGIGDGAQDLLRQHGIVTYQQLIDADPEAVDAMLKAAGSRADISPAIEAAKKMQD